MRVIHGSLVDYFRKSAESLPSFDFNSGLVKPLLTLRHRWVITRPTKLCINRLKNGSRQILSWQYTMARANRNSRWNCSHVRNGIVANEPDRRMLITILTDMILDVSSFGHWLLIFCSYGRTNCSNRESYCAQPSLSGMAVSHKSLWTSDVIWRWIPGSSLAQVMACCLTAPSHYLNQCWLLIRGFLWHLPECNCPGNARDTNPWYESENCGGQWVNDVNACFTMPILTGRGTRKVRWKLTRASVPICRKIDSVAVKHSRQKRAVMFSYIDSLWGQSDSLSWVVSLQVTFFPRPAPRNKFYWQKLIKQTLRPGHNLLRTVWKPWIYLLIHALASTSV